jgi:hypothetical protein
VKLLRAGPAENCRGSRPHSREALLKTHRTITDEVLKSNRTNARRSTGPRDTTHTISNARTHGLLAKFLVFDDAEEEVAFQSLSAELIADYKPAGCLETALVDEIAVCLWKMRKVNHLEQAEMRDRRKASRSILDAVVAHSELDPLPLFQRDDGTRSAARRGWECEELVVRTGTRNSRKEEAREETKNAAGQVHIEARLTTSIESLLRYTASTKRDFYKAIRALRDIQRERLEGSADGEATSE